MNPTNTDNYHYDFDDVYANIKLGSYGGFGFSSIDTKHHRHNDYYEITCVISGVYIHTYEGRNYNLTPGDLLLMSPHSEHQLYTEPMQATFFAICIREDFFIDFIKQHFPEFAGNILSKCRLVHLDLADFSYFEQLGRKLSVTRPSLHDADMLTYLALNNFFHNKNSQKNNNSEHVQRLLNVLNEPSLLHMSVERIYKTVNLSVPTITKIFKEQTGYTIVEYKNKKRMELAANMLKGSDKKIIDIAYELHYEALSCFLRAFKKEYGMTPTEYRKKYKND